MSVIVFLIALALLVALGFLGLFAWAVRSGQFDDTEGPPRRMLFDDMDSPKQENPPKGRE